MIMNGEAASRARGGAVKTQGGAQTRRYCLILQDSGLAGQDSLCDVAGFQRSTAETPVINALTSLIRVIRYTVRVH